MKTVNSDPHYITAFVLEYLEKGHELLVECQDGRKVTFDPYVCAVVPQDQTVALVGHYVKILEPFYTEKGCLLCSDMEVIAKEEPHAKR